MIGKASIRGKVSQQWGVYLVLAAALTGGMYGRLVGFGERQLAEDEYYFAEGVDRILKQGVPRFDDGGYYVQGLLPQYLTAVSLKLLGETNAALRLPALLFGLLVPFAAYRYARSYLPVPLALVLIAALFVSSWEIEFSRFARMYTELQFATLAFLYRFDRSIIGPDWKRRYQAHGWAVIATLCHLQGAMLAPLLFLPWLDLDNRDRFPDRGSIIRYSFVTAVVVVLVGGFAAFDFRRWGVADLFPPGYSLPKVSFLRNPQFVFWNPGGQPLVTLTIVVGLLALALVIGVVLARRGAITAPQAGLVLLVGAALLHQGVVAALIALALLLRYGIRSSFAELPRQRLLAAAAAGLFLFWGAVGLSAGEDWIRSSGAGSWMGALRRTFFSWPDWFDFLQPWAADLPVFGALTLLSIAVLLISRARSAWAEIFRGPPGILVYGILVFGVICYFREATRYSFLLYPAALTTVAAAAHQFAGLGRGVILFVAAFAVSGDFDPRHIAAAGEPSVAFRMGPFTAKEDLWLPREDYQSVAQYLRKIAAEKPEALFVVHYGAPIARQFQPPRYASYMPRSAYGFYEWSREGGTRDIWKRRLLLSTPQELREASRHDRVVWLVRRLLSISQLRPEAVWGERLERVDREFVSRDGRIEVLRVSLRAPSS